MNAASTLPSDNLIFARATILLVLLSSPGFARAQSDPDWRTLDEGQAVASTDHKLLFVFVEAEWCGICKRMKRETFPDPDILSLLKNRFVSVSIDLDSRETVSFNGEAFTERSFAQAMKVVGTPTMIFADAEGEILGETSGFYNRGRFLLLLSYVDSDRFQTMTFDEFEKEQSVRSN